MPPGKPTRGTVPHRHDAPGQEEGRLSARAPCAADGRLDTARLPGRRPLERLQPSRGAACLIWPRTGRPRVTRDNSGGFAGLGLPSGAEAYPIADALGSVIALTDGTGAKTDTYKYDPYGGNTGVTGTTPNPFRFAGEARGPVHAVQDQTALLLPFTGRWTQRTLRRT